MSTLPRVFLNPKEENEIKQGFPWIFDNEIAFIKNGNSQEKIIDTKLADGSVVEVMTKSGLYLGTGIFNKKSKITVRIMSRNGISEEGTSPFTQDFFTKRIQEAYDLRFAFYNKSDSYRLIFAEADYLPGLIVERYVDIENRVFLVIQFLALCVDKYRKEIIEALREVCKPFGIFERSDASVREKEGLEQISGWINGDHNPIITIKENGVLLSVDLEKGQKTGYFLDQKWNRAAVASLCKGKRVLDTFTHTGAFGLNAALAGASEVISVDISEEAIATVKNNIALNKVSNVMKAVCADVFDLLKEYEAQEQQFDVIILDPPAFAKSAKAVEKAYGGYKEINLRAMKLLKKGGILVSCSCSHFMDSNNFYGMIMHAAMDAHRSVQVLQKNGAGPDHPLLLGYPKSEYLKCAIMKVL